MNEDKLLIRIAEMYYLEDKNQSAISKELNIHRSTISRLLKKSREEGIVKITINYAKDEGYELEKSLKERFDLNKVIVVKTSAQMREEQKLQLMATATAEYLETILEPDQIIGFSWGQAMSILVENMKPAQLESIRCIPLLGGPAGYLESNYHVNHIVFGAAKKLNAQAIMIDAPALSETKEIRDALMSTKFIQEIVNLWTKTDIAIFGIGSGMGNLQIKKKRLAFYGSSISHYLSHHEAVGDIISRFYNSKGEHIVSELDEKLIGASLEDLQKINTRIGIAESKDKAMAILGALRGGYMNVVVTTEETAKEILELDKHK